MEMQAKRKAELGNLISQFQALLADNDPVDQMKERLQELEQIGRKYAITG